MNDFSTDTAAWVEAIGAIAAVVGAAWIAAGESRATRRREERNRLDALQRDRQTLVASKTAALNLAILAATQIHDLHALLRDETHRGRVARVSPSRTLVTTERLLIAFPIQSLGDAAAMVAFSYFPGALATAAEICANLEKAVRAAEDGERAGIFADYAKQIDQLDKAVRRRLDALSEALALPLTPGRTPR